jgi:hypothetical protein
MLAGVLFLRLYFHRVRYPAGCIRYQRIFCSENGHARLPSRRRSADRTRSPVPVSKKREFFKNIRQRLSPISLGNRPNRSLETNRQFTKARHWRAFLALPSVKSPVAGLPGWRRSADSHPSPRRFPANREFYREFCDFEGYESRFRSKKPLCSSHFSSNSLHKLTGKIF